MAKTTKKRSVTKSKAGPAKAKTYDDQVNYSGIMDEVEKKFNNSSMNVDRRAVRTSIMSTGLLSTDLMLAGGIRPGLWYTFFGGEGSAKSTHVSHMAYSCAQYKIPMAGLWDFEGCYHESTKLRCNGRDVIFADFVRDLPVPSAEGWLDKIIQVDTVGRKNVSAKIYYGGFKPITQITTSKGAELKASNHPVLVKTPDGPVWRKIEELVLGDVIYQRRAA